MALNIELSGAICGARITGLDLTAPLSDDTVAELRALWLKHRVLIFPGQKLRNADLERFSLYFGAFGDDPFFDPIDGNQHIAAIERRADETTTVFAEAFHTDWSFLDVPPAGTALYGITIPPQGGNTLYADQVAAYERLPDRLRDLADSLTAIHWAGRTYAPDGVYGDSDREAGRSMRIRPSEKALETREHPFVRTHRETGEKALFSSPVYIKGFAGMPKEESDALMLEFYQLQSAAEIVYSHKWEQDMLVIWDNRSLLHSATGGYDGYDRLLHRTTIADVAF